MDEQKTPQSDNTTLLGCACLMLLAGLAPIICIALIWLAIRLVCAGLPPADLVFLATVPMMCLGNLHVLSWIQLLLLAGGQFGVYKVCSEQAVRWPIRLLLMAAAWVLATSVVNMPTMLFALAMSSF